jgi:3-oxoacyl-[acyl-carrier-protein] synthase III
MSRPLDVAVAGWGAYAPERVLTNSELERSLDTTGDWVVDRTGIHERRIVGPGETTSTMAVTAAGAAIEDAGLTPDDIDVLVVATTTPDQMIPACSAFVSEGLGLRCGSFDLNAACAGFAYSLVVGSALIATGAGRVLVVGAEALSPFVDYEDRSTAVIFGDGAGAAVLQPSTHGAALLSWDLGCDGSAASLIEVPAGGSRSPATTGTVEARQHYLRMQGNEVFRRAVRAVVDSAGATLAAAGVTAADVTAFVPHQANLRIVQAAANRLGIPMERTIVNIERYGNTSAASIPLALAEAAGEGRIGDGDLVLLSGFGAGMTWASALLRWGRA